VEHSVAGVHRVFEILRAELPQGLRQTGAPTLASITGVS
jgi:hypothetical protein